MNAAVRFVDTFGQVSRFVEIALASRPSGTILSIDIGGSFFDCVASDASVSLKRTLVRSPSLLCYRSRQMDRRQPVKPADIIEDPVLFGRTDGWIRIDDNENAFKGYMLCAGIAPTRSMDAWRSGGRPINFVNFGDPLLALHQIEGAAEVLAHDRPILAFYVPDPPQRDFLLGHMRDNRYETIAISRLMGTEAESDELSFGCIAVPSEQVTGILQRFDLENRARKQGPMASEPLLDRIGVPRQRQSSELFGLHAKSPPNLHGSFAMADVATRSNCYPIESDNEVSWRWLGPGASSRMAVPCSFPGTYNFEFIIMACRTRMGLSGCRALVEGREVAVSAKGVDKGSVSFSGWLDPAGYKGYAEVDLINPGPVPPRRHGSAGSQDERHFGADHAMRLEESSVPARRVNVLVFTPTPTHPTIQGNRQRILDMCRALQSVGAELTILYYVADGLDAAAAQQMRDAWSDVEVVFTQGFSNRRTFVKHYAIDDWYDQRISRAVAMICQRKEFDFCIVNYAWYSKLFEALPQSVVRVIDTHDIFGDRAERFAEIGLDPGWFHTSVKQEAIALDRADFVVAIQDSEASVLEGRTKARVHSIGYLSPPDFLPARRQALSNRLTVGYLGSGNPFNVACMRAFARAAEMRSEIRRKVDILVAGQICDALRKGPQPFSLHGVVNSVTDFYRSVDVVINPMLGGTGLKMKSLEALGFGMPLVATSDAMTGIASNHPGHHLADMPAVIDRLLLLADEPVRLAGEASVSRETFLSYRSSQALAFLSFWSDLIDKTRFPRDLDRDVLEQDYD